MTKTIITTITKRKKEKIAITSHLYDCIYLIYLIFVQRIVPSLTKRYAGRRLMTDKVCSEYADRYFTNNETAYKASLVSNKNILET
jgi:hypothetical protein